MCFVRAGHVTPSSAPAESDDQSEYFTWQCGTEAPHRSARGSGAAGERGGMIARAWEKRPPGPSLDPTYDHRFESVTSTAPTPDHGFRAGFRRLASLEVSPR